MQSARRVYELKLLQVKFKNTWNTRKVPVVLNAPACRPSAAAEVSEEVAGGHTSCRDACSSSSTQ